MAPIYDSGSSLGRELNEEQIKEKLQNDDKFISYIRKGKAELRTDSQPDKKISHFELLKYIINVNVEFKKYIIKTIKRIKKKYLKEELIDIISKIDYSLPLKTRPIYGLSEDRKKFIIRNIDQRINTLIELCLK